MTAFSVSDKSYLQISEKLKRSLDKKSDFKIKC